VIDTGFGGFIDGRWKAGTVGKVTIASGGFLTTVTVSAGDKPKRRKRKGAGGGSSAWCGVRK